MITVPEIVEEIIKNSAFLENALSEGIINYSALARSIKPEIRKTLMKNVQEGAIIMALKRLSKKMKPNMRFKQMIQSNNDLIVRSNLFECVIGHVYFTNEMHKKLIQLSELEEQYFMTITEGVFETTIIASKELLPYVKKILSNKIITELTNLSSITIRLPKENIYIPGLYYYFLKALAWENINIVEVVSTYTEITLILENREVDHAFSVLKKSMSREVI